MIMIFLWFLKMLSGKLFSKQILFFISGIKCESKYK